MKLKTIPDDFVVNEIAAVHHLSSGPYGLYILEKRASTTADALKRIARSRGVSFSRFGYGGRKDKQARTFQYITVEGQEDLSETSESYRLTRIGFSRRPMGPDLISGNEFRVVLRSLDQGQVPHIRENAAEVVRCGFPNYFDDQWFNMDPGRGFMAERMLKSQWRGSLEIYLTSALPGDPDNIRKMKSRMRETWGDWEGMLQIARESGSEVNTGMLSLLSSEPGSFLQALQLIPGEELSRFFSAYQAYLWNEVTRRLLYEVDGPMDSYPGDAGPYLFYHDVEPGLFSYLAHLEIPLPANNVVITDGIVSAVYNRVLEERGIHWGRFNLRRLGQASFDPHLRKVIIMPTSLLVGEPVPDELNPGRVRVTLEFFLPSEGFGTMLVRRLSL